MSIYSTFISKDIRTATRKALSLYRDCLRLIPHVRSTYSLDLTPEQIKHRIRYEFRKQRGITDLKVIDMLIFKGRTELEEVRHIFKTKSHMIQILSPISTESEETETKEAKNQRIFNEWLQEIKKPEPAWEGKTIKEILDIESKLAKENKGKPIDESIPWELFRCEINFGETPKDFRPGDPLYCV